MSAVRLAAGEIAVPGHRLVRSGLRWLRADGQPIRAGEPLAYCSIALGGGEDPVRPFAAEYLQLVFASPIGGRFRHPGGAHGGFLDRLNGFAWDPEVEIGTIEAPVGETAGDAGSTRLLMLAGRNLADIADDRSGLLTGWHDQCRAWWGDGAAATLVGLGTCEQAALLRGDGGYFREMFEQACGPAHLIAFQDEPLVPCARTLAEQLGFTAADRAAIAADIAATFPVGPHVPRPDEWLFMGALLNALIRSPITDTHDLLGRGGLARSAPPAALSLSLTAELPQAGRHRRLGYTLNCHGYRLARTGPAVRHWLRTHFEPIPRAPDDIARDYRTLLRRLRGGMRPALFVFNSVSTQSYEQIQNYAALDEATLNALGTVRAKTLNLILHDLAREDPAFHIVDVDAIVAEMGMRAHLPDGVHPSGALQAEIRAELLRLLAAAGLPGFATG